MKLSDIYIRGRQFFAFLVPGVLWTVALVLVVLLKHPLDAVKGVSPSVWLAVGFFAISYCVGRASGNVSLSFAQGLSFLTRLALRLAGRFHAWLRRKAVRGLGRLIRGFSHRTPARLRRPLLGTSRFVARLSGRALPPAPHEQEEYLSHLEEAVFQVLRKRYAQGDFIERLAAAEAAHKASRRSKFPGPLFEFCKRIVNEKTQVLRLGLEDKEEEVNFFWMLPLPLFAFAAAWLAAGLWTTNIPPNVAPVYTRCCYVVFTAAILLALVFAYHLRPAQLAEKVECYFSFLTFHLATADRAEPPPAAPGGNGTAAPAPGRTARLEETA